VQLGIHRAPAGRYTVTREEAAEKLQDLLRISKSCRYGYPMDFSDEHMLEEVIAWLRGNSGSSPQLDEGKK
jgi:hypothetical protein